MESQIKETLETIESLIARGFYGDAAMMARVLSELLLRRKLEARLEERRKGRA